MARIYAIEAVLDRILKVHASISTTTLVVLQAPYTNRALSQAAWLDGKAARLSCDGA